MKPFLGLALCSLLLAGCGTLRGGYNLADCGVGHFFGLHVELKGNDLVATDMQIGPHRQVHARTPVTFSLKKHEGKQFVFVSEDIGTLSVTADGSKLEGTLESADDHSVDTIHGQAGPLSKLQEYSNSQYAACPASHEGPSVQ